MSSNLVDANTYGDALQDVRDRVGALESTGIIPVGLIAFCSKVVPPGWLLCDGSVITQTRYGQLVQYLGSTTLPNLAGRVVVGKAAAGTFITLGATGGVETVTLTGAESGVPAHTHPSGGTVTVNSTDTSVLTNSGTSTWDIANAGGGLHSRTFQVVSTGADPATPANSAAAAASAHTNLPPYIILNPIIKF